MTEQNNKDNIKTLRIILYVLLIIIFSAVVAANIYYFPRIKTFLIRRQANLTYQTFIDAIKRGDSVVAQKLTSDNFNKPTSSNNPPEGLPALSQKPISLSLLISQGFFKPIQDKSYVLYKSTQPPTVNGAKVITARFGPTGGEQYDITAQLINNNGQWQVDYVSLPSPVNGAVNNGN